MNWTFIHHRQKGLPFRPCEPSCVGAGSRRRRNVAHSLRRRMQMLQKYQFVIKYQSAIRGRTLLASVTVHVGLERRRTRKALVAHLALVFLLGVGGHLGAELAHHGLGPRGGTTSQQGGRTREGTRRQAIFVGFRGGRAVIGHGRVHRRNGSAVIGVIPAGGDG